MTLRTETGWTSKKVSHQKGGQHLNNNGQESKEPKGKEEKPPCPPIPPEKCDTWLANLKSQLRFIMTGQGKTNLMLTDAEYLYLTIDQDQDQQKEESPKHKKSFLRSMQRKLTPICMKYTPQIFNIKPPKSPEKNVKDWLEAMPEPDKCKTDSTVESLWWPTTEEKMTEIVDEDNSSKSTYIPRKDRKPTGKVDAFLTLYSNTTQLVPFKETSRSLVDLRTLETKRRNRIKPKNRFCKNSKKAAVVPCIDA